MKKKYSSVMLLWALILTVALSLFYAPDVMAAASGKVKSVTVTNLPSKNLTLKKGKSKTLKIKVTSTNKKKVSQKVTCKSSAPKVASVTNKGKVTAKKNGTAKITITSTANTKKKTVITVKVGTPATKVTIDKSSAIVVAGKSITLKATVTPKNASTKSVVWSSSDTKIAKVNSKGKVTGVKAGKANITAAAADGSGAKKTIPVTVESAKITVTSVSVVNDYTIKVSLSGTQKLAVSNFVVKLKTYDKGKYNKQCKLDNIASSNNKDYLLVLDSSDSRINNRDSVQVTVNGLRGGSSSGTATYNEKTFDYTDTEIYSARVDESIDETFSPFFTSRIGYLAYTVEEDKLPNGIKTEEKDNEIRFYGKPSQAGKFVLKVTSIDELGATCTYSITWLIGSKDTLVATADPTYHLLQSDGTVDVSDYYNETIPAVTATGGSGSYKYTLSGNSSGLNINETSGKISGTLKAAGTYNLKAVVEDKKDPNCKTETDVVINVSPSVTISGIVKDMAGNPVSNADITLENKDKANKYTSIYYNYTNEGSFSRTFVPGTYDIVAIKPLSDGSISRRYLYNQKLTATQSGFDIQLPMRKVVIESSDNTVKIDNQCQWYNTDGKSYGSGDTLYLRDGSTHKLTAEINQPVKKFKLEADITANAASARVEAKVTSEDITVASISANNATKVSCGYEYVYYAFKPDTTARYSFAIDTYSGAQICLRDDKNVLWESYYEDESSFRYTCTQNVTYYVGVRSMYSDSLETTLTITPVVDDPEDEGRSGVSLDADDVNNAAEMLDGNIVDEAAEAPVEETTVIEEAAETPVEDADVAEEAAETSEDDEAVADETTETPSENTVDLTPDL